jgi:hypothetical protein
MGCPKAKRPLDRSEAIFAPLLTTQSKGSPMNPIEVKLAQQLGAQQLEIIRLNAVLEEAGKEIARLKAPVPGAQGTANSHDVEKPAGAALQ